MKVVSLTRKNQITIPAEYVRALGFGENRKLKIERDGERLMLMPQKDLAETVADVQAIAQPFVKRTFSDEEIKEGRADAWTARTAVRPKSRRK